MKAFKDIEIFTRTAELGSLSEAARSLGITPSAASAALKRVEEDVDALLIVRSTRSLRLTQEGTLYLRYCQQALKLMTEARDATRSIHTAPGGTLRVSVSSDFGRNLLAPWLDDFQTTHPEFQIRLILSDHVSNVIKEEVDIAIRYGVPPDSTQIAVPLAPSNRRILCASPEFIARAGQPATPYDLVNYNCLCFMVGDRVHDQWHFLNRHKQDEAMITVTGNCSSNDGDMVRRWAVSGKGIAYKSELDVTADLRAGRLVQVCREWQGEVAPLYLVVADRRQLSPLVRVMKEFLQQKCEGLS
uniref:LysR family transcriptional regulator n=1 Tax=Marinobacterium profundum TaxID=1714300 RepID=UPI000A6A6379|nr:LysR family transcriptional regulator [Marinobacterium profundum]